MSKEIRVLVTNDSEEDTRLLVEQLAQGRYDVTYNRVDTLEAIGNALNNQQWDAVISECSLHRTTALEILTLVRQIDPDLPFIVVSEDTDIETAVEAIRLGASDYILKQHIKRVVPALERELLEAEERREHARKDAEWRETERRYHLLFHGVGEAVVIEELLYDEHGSPCNWLYLDVNPAFEAMIGVPRERLIGRKVTEVFGIERPVEAQLNAYARVVEEQKPVRFELYFPSLDRYFFISAFLIEGTRFASISVDITERKQVEEALEAEHRRLRAVLDSLPVGVFVADAQGRIVETNEQVNIVWGGTAPLSRCISDYAQYRGWWAETGDRIEADDWALARALIKGQTSVGEVINIERFDGGRGTILNSAAPILDAQARIVGAVAVVQDITEIVMLRQALEDALDQARRESERYAKLAAVAEAAFEREQRSSLMLQRALLPTRPFVPEGYRVAAEYHAAYAGEEVGGDFYDVFAAVDGKVGILIGDVSGKGIQAASVAATARSTIHTLAHDISSPGQVLTRANSVLCSHQMEMESFVTVFFAMLDPRTGTLSYANAGHPPALAYRSDAVVNILSHSHAPLCIAESTAFLDAQHQLASGEKVVLYTDGIIEARHDGRMFDEKGLIDTLRQHGHKTPEEIVLAIFDEAEHYAEGVLQDDAAVVVVERM